MTGHWPDIFRRSVSAAALTVALGAQTAWTERALVPREGYALACDTIAGQPLLFGGRTTTGRFQVVDETWRFDINAARWDLLVPARRPSPRCEHALAADSTRGRVVLFGGRSPGGVRGDTWEWDGTTWLARSPIASPSARSGHCMAFDSVRNRTVLFGGWNNVVHPGHDDTWEWDGAVWSRRNPARRPPAGFGYRMAYDPLRQRTVLFGEAGGRSETWEWDGTTWTRFDPLQPPAPRRSHGMAFDPGRGAVVLFAGRGVGGDFADVAVWDGATWTDQRVVAGLRGRVAACTDAARGLIVAINDHTDTAIWTGATRRLSFRRRDAIPDATSRGVVFFDSRRGRVAAFPADPGSRDVWEWDADAGCFVRRPTAGVPRDRAEHAVAFDRARGRAVLFGGSARQSVRSDTWEWDGSRWLERSPALRPPGRALHAMVYDARRRRVVMFGGRDASGAVFGDTWEWDGNGWTNARPPSVPPARSQHALVYDAERGVTVLFGGVDRAGQPLRDLWEWDGARWTMTGVTAPPGVLLGAGAYDVGRRRVVAIAFRGSGHDTFEWVAGTTGWVRRAVVRTPGGTDVALCYDECSERVVLLAGRHLDTWEYGAVAPAHYATSATGCVASHGRAPFLVAPAFERPYVGTTFRVDIRDLPPGPASGALITGISDTRWAGGSLPFDLTGIGMPGCSLRASPDVLDGFTGRNNSATWSTTLANDPSLVGLPFFQQALVLDPSANALGIVVSDLGRGQIGAL